MVGLLWCIGLARAASGRSGSAAATTCLWLNTTAAGLTQLPLRPSTRKTTRNQPLPRSENQSRRPTDPGLTTDLNKTPPPNRWIHAGGVAAVNRTVHSARTPTRRQRGQPALAHGRVGVVAVNFSAPRNRGNRTYSSGVGLRHTETWFSLSPVNGEPRQSWKRFSSSRPASRAMRSHSAGQTYLNSPLR